MLIKAVLQQIAGLLCAGYPPAVQGMGMGAGIWGC